MGKFRKFVQDATFGSRREDAAQIPKSGTGLFWFVLRNHYLQMILLNLLFVALCLPVVTIPAAYSGLMAVLMKWTRRVPVVEILPTFFAEFKSHFWGKLGVWLLTAAAPLSAAGYVYLFTGNEAAFYALLLIFSLAVFLLQSYFFAQLCVLELSAGGALKNSFILLGLEWKRTLRILATGGLLLILCVVLTTYMIPFILLCVFSLTALSVCSETSAVIDSRLCGKPS